METNVHTECTACYIKKYPLDVVHWTDLVSFACATSFKE